MDGYTYTELGSIFAMQGFAGISLFSVLLLMALGLAIIFGQMGVINMAHGEFMAVGAYTTYMLSTLTETYAPDLMPYYFVFSIVVAFFIAAILGYLAEFALIRHLYKRPLDTQLATWGHSLLMQQSFRSIFGAREVSPTLPEWLLGSYQPIETIDIPLNGMFVLALTTVVTLGVYYLLFRSRWGLRVRATTQNRIMSDAVGINTQKVDRYTFALGCGIAGIAGAAFTTIASTGPTTGTLYIVDTFMVVVFGGAASLLGTILSAFTIAQAQSILEFFISGSMAKVYTLLALV
ncbi:MAG: urea ABC transporter permease subunit UrtB, partial [Halioglobus sp.]